MTVIPIEVGVLGTVHKNLEKRLVELENKRTIGTIQNTVLLKISWETKKSPIDLKRLAVT